MTFEKGSTPVVIAPIRAGVILSGGPEPGGRNVIAGLFIAIKSIHPESSLIGFLKGPDGPLTNKGMEIDAQAPRELPQHRQVQTSSVPAARSSNLTLIF